MSPTSEINGELFLYSSVETSLVSNGNAEAGYVKIESNIESLDTLFLEEMYTDINTGILDVEYNNDNVSNF